MKTPTLRIDQFMTRSPLHIDASEPLQRAHELMRAHKLRHLPVTANGDLVGMLSIRDLHLIETLRDIDLTEVPVDDAMSRPPYVVAPDASLDDVVATMADRKLGSAIVFDRGKVIGIFTTTDALHALLGGRVLSRIRS